MNTLFRRFQISPLQVFLQGIALVLLALLATQAAYAVDVPTVAQIMGKTPGSNGNPGSDKSVEIFTWLLGDFFTRPLTTLGGSTGLIGSMFLVFNSCIFVVGMLWAGYGILGGIAETAESGEVLGKRLSATWMPIRMVTGIGGIVPVFAGFSLSQVLIVTMTGIGIGIANSMWMGAISDMDRFTALSPPGVMASSQGGLDFEPIANDLFKVQICTLASLDSQAERAAKGVPVSQNEVVAVYAEPLGVDKASVTGGSGEVPRLCGRAVMQKIPKGDPSWWSIEAAGTSPRTFSLAGIKYDDYSNEIAKGYSKNFLLLNKEIAELAKKWFDARKAQNADATKGVAPYPTESIRTLAQKYAAEAYKTADAQAAAINSATGGQKATALTPYLKLNMEKAGWLSAGSWFSTLAETNAAAADAMKASSYKFEPPRLDNQAMPQFVRDILSNGVSKSIDTKITGQNVTDEGDMDALQNWLIEKSGCKGVRFTSSTGNVSLGQALIQCGIGMSRGTGGGNLVNPIIMFKNLGDRLILIGEGIYALKAVASVAGVDPNDTDSVSGKATNKVANATPLGRVLLGLWNFLSIIAPYLIVIGALMAIYIPMVPFVTWIGGVVQYCVVVCQGLVGAPIAALSHMEAEGEGMGRRTEPGYMFVLNVTFRPALMLFGFFLASSLLIVIGTFQIDLFVSAMAGAQGNSITGIVSLLGYLTLFLVVNITLIQSLFNMIFLLPDQVLGLIGSSGPNADMGRDAEHKMHGTFVSVASAAQRATHGMGQGAGGDKKPGADAVKGQRGGGGAKGTSTQAAKP